MDPATWRWLVQNCEGTNYKNKYVSMPSADPHNFVGQDNNDNDESDNDDYVNDDMDLCDSFRK
jgi:hypothetical protein